MDPVDAFGGSFPTQAALAEAAGLAPREGAVLTTDGRYFMADKCKRWPATPHSISFGEAIYFTPTKLWVHFLPASFLDPPKATVVTPEVALAFLLREQFDIPQELSEAAAKMEV